MPAKKAPAKKAAKKAAPKKAIKKSKPKKAAKKPAKKSAKKSAGKDKKEKVKRPPSAYMNYCKAARAGIVKANPKATFGEVGKLLGASWGKLDDAKKASYKK